MTILYINIFLYYILAYFQYNGDVSIEKKYKPVFFLKTTLEYDTYNNNRANASP